MKKILFTLLALVFLAGAALMILLSMAIAAMSAIGGHLSAITVPGWFGFRDTSTAGMMAVVAGIIFSLVFLFAPRYGLLSRILRRSMLTVQITRDDILGMLFRFHELAPAGAPPIKKQDLHGALKLGMPVKLAVWDLLRSKRLHRMGDGYQLTASGMDDGRTLVRSHRLWESYLCDKLGVCAADVHHQAHQLEHYTDAILQSELDRSVGHPVIDPHEREIPPVLSGEKDR